MQQNVQNGNPCIRCSVNSCRHNHSSKQLCKLSAINVCPNPNQNSGKPDESKCDSYEH